MSVIADVRVPSEEFVLGRLLDVGSGVEIRLESMVPMAGTLIPYLWVRNPDEDEVLTALRESGLVSEVRPVDGVDGETLLRVDWDGDIDGVIESLVDSDAAVLDGASHGDDWSFQLRFPEYDALSGFYRDVVDKGVSLDVERVHNPVEASNAGKFDLSPEQREALLVALGEGYFEVPRRTSLVELSEELGVSDSAVSQRIRRGLTKVLSATIAGPGVTGPRAGER